MDNTKKEKKEKKVINSGKFKDSSGKEWDLRDFDDTGSLIKLKRDNNFYGHTKCQTLF